MNNIITLFTEEVLDSCHHLEEYVGACSNKHGHSWLIKIWIQGNDNQKDKVGILFDFGNIKKIKTLLDHTDINNVLVNENPTAENISKFIITYLCGYNQDLDYRVRVYETAVLKETYAQRQTDGFSVEFL
jgi:6-pyruvoyl-tetrahydropterin synthase